MILKHLKQWTGLDSFATVNLQKIHCLDINSHLNKCEKDLREPLCEDGLLTNISNHHNTTNNNECRWKCWDIIPHPPAFNTNDSFESMHTVPSSHIRSTPSFNNECINREAFSICIANKKIVLFGGVNKGQFYQCLNIFDLSSLDNVREEDALPHWEVYDKAIQHKGDKRAEENHASLPTSSISPLKSPGSNTKFSISSPYSSPINTSSSSSSPYAPSHTIRKTSVWPHARACASFVAVGQEKQSIQKIVLFGGTSYKYNDKVVASEVVYFDWINYRKTAISTSSQDSNNRCRWYRPRTSGVAHPGHVSCSATAIGATSNLIMYFGGMKTATGKTVVNTISILDTITWVWSKPLVHNSLPITPSSLTPFSSEASSSSVQDLHPETNNASIDEDGSEHNIDRSIEPRFASAIGYDGESVIIFGGLRRRPRNAKYLLSDYMDDIHYVNFV